MWHYLVNQSVSFILGFSTPLARAWWRHSGLRYKIDARSDPSFPWCRCLSNLGRFFAKNWNLTESEMSFSNAWKRRQRWAKINWLKTFSDCIWFCALLRFLELLRMPGLSTFFSSAVVLYDVKRALPRPYKFNICARSGIAHAAVPSGNHGDTFYDFV